MRLTPPIVGRDGELEILMSSLGEVISGSGTLVLIAGEVGIGKTRLAEEFEKLGSRTGVRVLVGRCIPGSQTPYLAFQEAFASLHIKPFEELRNSEKVPRSSTNNDKILFSTLELLRVASTEAPIILRLDDLHWVDPESMQLIHFLVRNLDGVRVLIVCAYRPEDITSETKEGTNPLLDFLRMMRREGVFKELTLGNLDTDQIRQAIEGMLEGSIDAELLQKVACESSGNPLFIVETIISLISSNTITMENGVWRIPVDIDVNLPSSVREVIMARIDKLTKDQKLILDYASVIGENFDPDLLATSLNMTKLQLIETLDEINVASHVIIPGESCYQFCHHNVRNLVYERVSRSRRKEIHCLIASILEKKEHSDELDNLLSWHYCMGGDKRMATKYSLIVGESFLAQGEEEEARVYLKRAAEAAKDVPELEEEVERALNNLN